MYLQIQGLCGACRQPTLGCLLMLPKDSAVTSTDDGPQGRHQQTQKQMTAHRAVFRNMLITALWAVICLKLADDSFVGCSVCRSWSSTISPQVFFATRGHVPCPPIVAYMALRWEVHVQAADPVGHCFREPPASRYIVTGGSHGCKKW